MQKIHIGFMKDLHNREFQALYTHIIKIMDTHRQMYDGNIKLAFEEILPYKEKLKYALVARGKNEYSVANQALIIERNNYLNALRKRVESYLKSPKPQECVAARRVNEVLQQYGKKFYVPTITTQARFVTELTKHIRDDEDFKNSLNVLEVMDLMDTIIKISHEIEVNVAYFTITTVRCKTKREGVRKAAYLDLKVMVDIINSTFLLHRNDSEKIEANKQLIFTINAYIKIYRMKLKTRITKRKNKKATAELELLKTQQEEQMDLSVEAGELKSDPSATLKDRPSTPLSERSLTVSETSNSKDIGLEKSISTNMSEVKDENLTTRNNFEDSPRDSLSTTDTSKNNLFTTNKKMRKESKEDNVGFPPITKN